MLKRVNKIFIGKDINRTAALVDGAALGTVQGNIVEGELVALDENFKVLAATATYTNTKTIYIAEGTSETIKYNNEAGTAFTARKIIVSDPINGSLVKSYKGKVYEAKTEEIVTIGAISGTITAGTEYVLRLVYNDINEHPGQFTSTYRYVAKSGDTSQSIFDGLRKRIAKHTGKLSIGAGARITASGTTTLILTAKAIPGCTTGVNDIDELTMVNFDVYFNYVDNDYNWAEVPVASFTKTNANWGNGSWEAIRDIEKFAMAYKGINNFTIFPVIKPEFRTVKGETYDTLVIEHDIEYRSPDNQYNKQTSVTTMIACPYTATTGLQLDTLATSLDSWFASIPGKFTASGLNRA